MQITRLYAPMYLIRAHSVRQEDPSCDSQYAAARPWPTFLALGSVLRLPKHAQADDCNHDPDREPDRDRLTTVPPSSPDLLASYTISMRNPAWDVPLGKTRLRRRRKQKKIAPHSELTLVHDPHPVLLVLVLCNPQLMKRPEGSEDRPAQPAGIPLFVRDRWRVNLDFLLWPALAISVWVSVLEITVQNEIANFCLRLASPRLAAWTRDPSLLSSPPAYHTSHIAPAPTLSSRLCHIVAIHVPLLPSLSLTHTHTHTTTQAPTHPRQEPREIRVQPLRQPLDPRAIPNHHHILQQPRANVDITRHDAVVHELREGHGVFERVRVLGRGRHAQRCWRLD